MPKEKPKRNQHHQETFVFAKIVLIYRFSYLQNYYELVLMYDGTIQKNKSRFENGVGIQDENERSQFFFSIANSSYSTMYYYDYQHFIPLSNNLWITDLFDMISSKSRLEVKLDWNEEECMNSKNGKQ